jgi:hypothetical protein
MITGLIIIAGIGTDGSTGMTGTSIVILEGTTRIPVTTDSNGWDEQVAAARHRPVRRFFIR